MPHCEAAVACYLETGNVHTYPWLSTLQARRASTQLGSDCFFGSSAWSQLLQLDIGCILILQLCLWHWSWSLDRNHGFPTADPSPVDALAPRARSNPHALPPIRPSSTDQDRRPPPPSLPSARHRVAWGPLVRAGAFKSNHCNPSYYTLGWSFQATKGPVSSPLLAPL